MIFTNKGKRKSLRGAAALCPGLCAGCPFRSDKFGCTRHSIQGKLDALLSLARTVRAHKKPKVRIFPIRSEDVHAAPNEKMWPSLSK